MLVGALLVSGGVFAAGGVKVEVTNASLAVTGSVTATGSLTDTQLRASPLSVNSTEVSISTIGTPTTVSVSTSAWTMVPAASSMTGREGIMVSLPTTLNAVVVGHLGNCTSTAVATTVRPLEFAKGGFVLVPVGPGVCLWTLSLHTGAESIHVQEIGQ